MSEIEDEFNSNPARGKEESGLFSDLAAFEPNFRPYSVASNLSGDETSAIHRMSGVELRDNYVDSIRPSIGAPSSFRPIAMQRSISCPTNFKNLLPVEAKRPMDFYRAINCVSRDTSRTLPLSPERILNPVFDVPADLKLPRPESALAVLNHNDHDVSAEDEDEESESSPEKKIDKERENEMKIPARMSPPPSCHYVPAQCFQSVNFRDEIKADSGLEQSQSNEQSPDRKSSPSTTTGTPRKALESSPTMFTRSTSSSPGKLCAPRAMYASGNNLRKSSSSRYAKPQKVVPKVIPRGLKYLSNRICETLAKMGSATQESIISKLYQSFISENDASQEQSEKSIRRRIYDTLNVLMALGMVRKEKQTIEWIGRPGEQVTADDVKTLKKRVREADKALAQKRKSCEEENLLYYRTKTLLERNSVLKKNHGRKRRRIDPETDEEESNEEAEEEDVEENDSQKKIYFPFLIFKADENSKVVCKSSNKDHKYRIDSTSEIEILNDYDILDLMAQG
mmetsp:Transcript_16626/g.24999  ORF Transcript_16626/g.24999 Transcript_16626/m.24999 type:complete len:510 (+) Transcript_16626:96-1625(+)|eukprot:CAMPEP_0167757040 /NCGR_PEP_ID=MMETSP0110_2-20121227/9712_1 /TAXON_ID=629695 /ORGANISM="Gymnochlora sp., Strain CCMP2014" /LENGTH=509 /DNA_ID=CAMNT_0007643201 /DNA_START=105 /DNA_END=1634 /DNA_ORIENTATION=-